MQKRYDGDLDVNAIEELKGYIQSRRTINSAVMPVYMHTIHPIFIKKLAKSKNLNVKFYDNFIDVIQSKKIVRLNRKHSIYLKDVVDNFDFYHNAVHSISMDGLNIVDYSTPRFHEVIGFDGHPIYFPSLAEPLVTTQQYLDFAQIGANSVALDLGAYSGLTSIMMRDLCGEGGRVVAVDADDNNLIAIRKNISLYERSCGRVIDLVEAAVWSHGNGITFSSEGNMGSSATNIVGERIGASRHVPSITLSQIVTKFNLPKVDFIKCDIEGGEAVIFEDAEFFKNNRPRIIAEVHLIRGKMTTASVEKSLSPFGYSCKEVSQPGSDLPLLECLPD